MDCLSCGFENRDDATFCGECGASVAAEIRCPRCERANPPGRKFCDGCGQRLAETAVRHPERDPRDYTPKHLADKILQSKSALEGERKQVTVLFADVKGSMELSEQLDPEEWHRVLDRFFEILTDGVHRFEGTVNQYTGDGIMALFGAPIAHEDHAQRGCYAALHLRDLLRSYSQQLRREYGLDFQTRIGLNSGEVVVGKIGDDLRMDYTAQGQVVHLAERMERLAEAGRVYVAPASAALVEGYFALEDLGEFKVRGAQGSLHVYELLNLGTLRTRLDVSRARGFSRFVGRADEMASLELALHRATNGDGQVVGIVGEAGVGKSRLCLEFLDKSRALGVAVYDAHCPAYGKTVPLLPLLELLRNLFGIGEHDTSHEARRKIAGELTLLDGTFDEVLPVVFDLLGVPDPERPAEPMDLEARQRQLYNFVRSLVHARGRRAPEVLLLDDLHWVDPGSDAFVAQIVEAVAGTRTLLLVNFRPEYHAEWMGKSYYQQLSLAPLGPEAIGELLRELLGSDPSISGLTDLIRVRTGGNPFFIEEVVQSLAESGSLVGTRGAYRLAEALEELAIPASVQVVLAARIDRLPEREKGSLQTAAVIGRKFAEVILKRVSELPEDQLAAALAHLREAEFVLEEALYPEVEYAFKHPLTQDVAYESQLSERRARVHAEVARAIEEIDASRLDERAPLLAHHWEAAGERLDAARWHARAADWVRVNDYDEALRHWRRIRTLLDELPDSEEAIEIGLGARLGILQVGGPHGLDGREATSLMSEGRALAEQAENAAALTQLLLAYGSARIFAGDAEDGLRCFSEAEQVARDLADRDLESEAQTLLSWANISLGRLPDALALAEAALDACADNPRLAGQADYYRVWALSEMGRIAEVRTRTRPRFEQQLSPRAMAGRRRGRAQRAAAVGDFDQALREGRAALEICERLHDANGQVAMLRELGNIFARQDLWDEAAECFETACETARTVGTFLNLEASLVIPLARAYLGRGDWARARATADEALAVARKRGSRQYEAYAEIVSAQVMLETRGLAAAERAEQALDRAASLIEKTSARLYEPLLRIQRGELARLRQDDDARHSELSGAHRLYIEMGDLAYAERVARDLEELRSRV